MIERERQRPNLILGPPPGSVAALAFLRATGFAYHSTLWDLALPLDRWAAAPAWPAELVARSFDRARDVAPWVALFNAAFAEHPTPLQVDEEMVVGFNDDPDVDDADLLVLEDPAEHGALVGFCSTEPQRSAGWIGSLGDIAMIGVRPDRQGRGLGRQLLRWGVGHLRSLGVGRVLLSVNGRNEHAFALSEVSRQELAAHRRARTGIGFARA